MTVIPDPARDWALFLDVDGTLIHIAERPDAVQPCPRLGQILSRASETLDGALALVSGRSIADIDALTDHSVRPAAGLHGLEMRTADGRYATAADDTPALLRARQRLQALIQAHPGLHLEDKRAALALHYRGACEAAIAAARETADRIVDDAAGSLTRLAGKSVYEIKPARYDKGDAIRALLETEPFTGRRPVYIGDDVTDEAGFAAVNALGGVSIRVGAAERSEARYQLDTVDEVLAWLEATIQTLQHAITQPT